MTPAALAELHAQCFRVPAPFTARAFSAFLASPHCFLCTLPHGFALGRAVAGEAELLTLAVHPDHRRAGTGRALLDGFEATARARDAQMAFLEVSAENAGAIALYAAAGYAESGRRAGYYRDSDGSKCDAILMERSLTRG
ncbi:MAG: GNAT family N-acetyltransferase [Rhodobacter sp.]|nr:GNAT family N-acetyltransferase [Rhodobacter sp.]